jgi:NADPH-dependent 2,4-dienoyl-CoA reductase/sulfur reductase-like enzyme
VLTPIKEGNVAGMTGKRRSPDKWDFETDVVVVGAGFAGLVAAAIARGRGAEVMVLEADDEIGGIMRISSGEYWIPNNACMREAGIDDSPIPRTTTRHRRRSG